MIQRIYFTVLFIIISLALITYFDNGRAWPFVIVNGESMAPTYHVGQWIIVKTIDHNPVDINDIIVYRPYGDPKFPLIVHRVIGNDSTGYITKGDHNELSDQELPGYMNNITVKSSWIYGVV